MYIAWYQNIRSLFVAKAIMAAFLTTYRERPRDRQADKQCVRGGCEGVWSRPLPHKSRALTPRAFCTSHLWSLFPKPRKIRFTTSAPNEVQWSTIRCTHSMVREKIASTGWRTIRCTHSLAHWNRDASLKHHRKPRTLRRLNWYTKDGGKIDRDEGHSAISSRAENTFYRKHIL